MADKELAGLPSVDRILGDEAMRGEISHWGLQTVKGAVRALQAEVRAGRSEGVPTWAHHAGQYGEHVHAWLLREVGHGYARAFNLTGTIIHTNLGRALLHPHLLDEVLMAASRPTTLEYDLRTGRRGSRDGLVVHRLKLLTGAEAACVVNNNAAALMLVLNTLALDRPVPVSRGELIEIGGSFRLPELMTRAGCVLREVGTTNRTHVHDYEAALEDAALLLKVHPSNYHVSGFTKDVSVRELAELGGRAGLAVCVDLGSGSLVDLQRYGLPHEPTPKETLAQGASLVTFSGDKLLGGIQAGIIVGDHELIEALNRNPLKRALRLDKITLALLDATLKAYEDEATLVEHIPLLRTLTLPLAELNRRGEAVMAAIRQTLGPGARVSVVDSAAQLGSGSLPDQSLPSRAVRVDFDRDRTLREFEERLRWLTPAVIGRIEDGAAWLDMRGAEPLDELIETLGALETPA